MFDDIVCFLTFQKSCDTVTTYIIAFPNKMLFQKPIKPRKTATSQKAAAPYEVVVVKADSNANRNKPEALVCDVSIS